VDDDGHGLEYTGSLIYRRNGNTLELESTSFGGGRIEVSEGTSGNIYTPNYFLTDHLGSTRAVVTPNGTVRERNDYHPFGLRWSNSGTQISDNRFRFSGKENQTTGNLPYQDFGARFFGGKLPIWTTPDPLAEKYYSWSQYNYTLGNPVLFIDRFGLEPQKPEDGHEQDLREQRSARIKSHIESSLSIDRAKSDIATGAINLLYRAGRAIKDIFTEATVGGIKSAGDKLEAGESLSVGDVAGVALDFAGLIPGGAIAKGAVKGAKVVNGFTKSSLKIGQEMHNAYKLGDRIDGVAIKEYGKIPGIRPDFVDLNTRTIYELKPNNPRAIKAGEKQLQRYKSAFEAHYPSTSWKTVLDTY
jgi:RHS repeat-associated protein